MPITYYARSSGDIDVSREEFYVYLMNTLDQLELNGEQCLLRAICEVAQTPFHTNKKNSVLEKIAQFVFTPSQCCNFDNKLEQERTLKNSSLTERLLHAQSDGMTSKKCGLIYSKCTVSIVNLISQKRYERYCARDYHKISKRTLLFPATTVLQAKKLAYVHEENVLTERQCQNWFQSSKHHVLEEGVEADKHTIKASIDAKLFTCKAEHDDRNDDAENLT